MSIVHLTKPLWSSGSFTYDYVLLYGFVIDLCNPVWHLEYHMKVTNRPGSIRLDRLALNMMATVTQGNNILPHGNIVFVIVVDGVTAVCRFLNDASEDIAVVCSQEHRATIQSVYVKPLCKGEEVILTGS